MQVGNSLAGRVARAVPVAVLAAVLLLAGCATTITRTADNKRVELPQMVQEVADAKVILLGEKHDDARSHRLQLDVIRALHDRGKNLAIAAEMFSFWSQPKLDIWNEGRMDSLTFQWLFQDDWSEEWSLYRDIFLYARSQKIPIVGINFEHSLVRTLSRQGVNALSPRETAQLPANLSCDHNTPYSRLLEAAYRGHDPSMGSFENFCLAQTAWNRGMGSRVADYLQQHPDKTLVVLAGAYHAVRSAIPAAAGIAGARIVVPAATVGAGPGAGQQADFVFK